MDASSLAMPPKDPEPASLSATGRAELALADIWRRTSDWSFKELSTDEPDRAALAVSSAVRLVAVAILLRTASIWDSSRSAPARTSPALAAETGALAAVDASSWPRLTTEGPEPVSLSLVPSGRVSM